MFSMFQHTVDWHPTCHLGATIESEGWFEACCGTSLASEELVGPCEGAWIDDEEWARAFVPWGQHHFVVELLTSMDFENV